MIEFYQTRAGRVFFEVTLPGMVREISRLNDLLERITIALEKETVASTKSQPNKADD